VNGKYPNRALDASDAKLRFTFMPSKDITVVNRMSNSSAAAPHLRLLLRPTSMTAAPRIQATSSVSGR